MQPLNFILPLPPPLQFGRLQVSLRLAFTVLFNKTHRQCLKFAGVDVETKLCKELYSVLLPSC